jgi:hypothetical protein
MKSPIRLALLALAAAFVLLQLYPVDRRNPPSSSAMAMPDDPVGTVLRAACMDCHSNETVWPWYSKVAPASFFVASHVNEGREHLNFSTWTTEDVESRDHMLEEIVEVLEEGEMPLRSYTLLHGEARLDDGQRALLMDWARSRRAELGVVDSEGRGERDERDERAEEGRRGGD